MRCSVLLLCLSCAGWAQEPATLPTADPLVESKRVNTAIAELTARTPIAQEMELLRDKLNESQRTILAQMNELSSRPEWQEYERRLHELQSHRMERLTAEREALAAAGRTLYGERHAELRRHAPAEIIEGRRLGFDVLSYPSVDGSTSTHPLSVIIASRLLNVPYAWRYVEPTGMFLSVDPETLTLTLPYDPHSSAGHRESLELNISAARVYATPASEDEVAEMRAARIINSLLANHSDTHTAHVRLIRGECDLILSARPPSESERTLARDRNVKIESVPIARDALVFILNRQNRVENLTRKQLRDIYEERITRWSEVGGADEPILPLRRERDSGSRELFDELLMSGEQLPEPTDPFERELFELRDMSGPYNRITRIPAALGYSVYYYERYMALSPQTRTIAIDGVLPTFHTIQSGEYPFVASVYATYRDEDPPDSPGRKLLQWLLSPEGQSVVRESGYVPVGGAE